MERRVRALKQIDERELKSFETARMRTHRVRARGGHGQMPALTLELKPPGRKAAPHKAKNRYISPLARELAESVEARPPSRRSIDLSEDFTRAARDDESREEGGSTGSSESSKPSRPARPQEPRPRRRDRDNGNER